MGDSPSPPGIPDGGRPAVVGRAHGRLVLRYFSERSASGATLGDLTEFVAGRDRDVLDRSRVEIRLHHVTLPKLDEAGVVEYDARSHAVRYRGDSTERRSDWAAQPGET